MTLTFRNDSTLKSDLLTELVKHRERDQFLHGTYSNDQRGDDFRGCSLGCSIHSMHHLRGVVIDYNDHAGFAKSIGVPIWLVWLQDAVFENLLATDAPDWTERLISAIPEGVTPETLRRRVLAPFMVFVLANCRGRADANGKAAIDTVIALWSRVEAGNEPTDDEWSAANAVADAVAQHVAQHAAHAAVHAATWSAADAAAWSAADAAVWSAADAAADAAASAAAWSAARFAASAAAWSRYADELVRLLESCG